MYVLLQHHQIYLHYIAINNHNLNNNHNHNHHHYRLQIQRSQNRIRRSACSDLQSTAIPEERVYNENRRRASLFVGRPPQQTVDIPKISSCDQEPS